MITYYYILLLHILFITGNSRESKNLVNNIDIDRKIEMSQSQGKKQSDQPSLVLTPSENDVLFQLTGPKCVALASAVAQVYLADPPFSRWNKKHVGVATFIKDNGKRSYYIRVYDIESRYLMWEQELYNQFDYKVLRSFFHSFDTDDCPAGLNFCNEEEARFFSSAIIDHINKKEKRRAERTMSVKMSKPLQINQPTLSSSSSSINNSFNFNSMKNKKFDNKTKKGDKKKFDKKDISTPSDFRHVSHVGWDPDKGFDMNEIDPDMKSLFEKVGLDESQLKDKETAKFVYNFLEERGGVEAVKKERSRPPAPPVSQPIPQTNLPGTVRGGYNRGGRSGPPPPPTPHTSRPGPPVPPTPIRSHPAPPIPNTAPPALPQFKPNPPPVPQTFQHGGGGGGSMPGAPLPPPPPGPPPPPSMPQPQSGSRGSRSEAPQSHDESNDSDSGRNALLVNIREGVSLKKVSETEQLKPKVVEDDSIAGALALALRERQRILHDSDEEDDDDDDNWDD